MEPTEYAAKELKAALEGLAKHLFGDVECRWWVPVNHDTMQVIVG
jgi:hypothetical protein